MSDAAKREAVLGRFSRQYDHFPDLVGPDLDAMADRIVRLERILAALREPSIVVVDAATEVLADCRARCHAGAAWDAPYFAIRAAVAAAEQEVGHA